MVATDESRRKRVGKARMSVKRDAVTVNCTLLSALLKGLRTTGRHDR